MASTFAPTGSSNQDHATPTVATQAELPLLKTVRKPERAPDELVAKCRHRLDAIRLCIQLSGLSNDTVCKALGIDNSHFTRMMSGRASFPDAKSLELMRVCGNYAPLQYEAQALGFELVEKAKPVLQVTPEEMRVIEALRRVA